MLDFRLVRVNKAITRALRFSRAGNHPAAWRVLFPHRGALSANPDLAAAWVELAERANAGHARRRELLTIIESWPNQPALVSAGAAVLLAAFDGRPHDHRPPPNDPMRRVCAAVEVALAGVPSQAPLSAALHYRLGSALRLCGEHDAAIDPLTSAVTSAPQEHGWRYDLGLTCKLAGRFVAALEHFQAYAAARGDDDEGLLWNLAICATGAGQGALARDQWHAMGMTDTVLGEDGLPLVPDLGLITVRIRREDGTFVELEARPQSPCHGRIASPSGLRGLWDGAPVRTVLPGQPPCLPLLARLPEAADAPGSPAE